MSLNTNSPAPAASQVASQVTQKLSVSEKVFYGVGDIANGLAVSAIGFWLLFYLTEVAGIGPMLAGTAIMLGRAWDAVTDPIMGWLTDKTNTRWGKRRPYLLFGAITYAATFFMLWVVPAFETEMARFIYITGALVLFNTALTVVFVPYTSLTASITSDYGERSSLTGYRMVCSQIAFLIGAALPAQLIPWMMLPETLTFLQPLGGAELFGSWWGTARLGYLVFAALFAVIMLASIWTCFAGVRERALPGGTSATTAPPFSYFSKLVMLVRTCQPFRQSLLIKLLSTCAVTLIAVKLPYYITYVLGMSESKTEILTVLFITAILSTPLWVLASRRWGKVESYRVAMAGYALLLLCLPALGSGPTTLIYPIAIIAGFFHSAALMLPWAIIPDVVEYDELQSGERREGLLYGGTAFAYKLASALAVFIAGIGLEHSGYEPNVTQSTESVRGILGMLAVTPAVLLALSIFASRGYLLTAKRHGELREELRQRAARQ